jgi:hypothetical protein
MSHSHWELVDGWTKTVQVLLLQSKVKDILGELHGAYSGGHVGVNRMLGKCVVDIQMASQRQG